MTDHFRDNIRRRLLACHTAAASVAATEIYDATDRTLVAFNEGDDALTGAYQSLLPWLRTQAIASYASEPRDNATGLDCAATVSHICARALEQHWRLRCDPNGFAFTGAGVGGRNPLVLKHGAA